MGRAFSEVIGAELGPVPNLNSIGPARIMATDRALGSRPAAAPGVSTEEDAALAAGAAQVGYGTYHVAGGRLRASLRIQNAATLKDVRLISADVAAADFLGAAKSLAKQISEQAGNYSTSNEEAVQAFATALDAGDPASMEANATRAIAADPNFGPAYRLLAKVKGRDRDAALAVLDRGLAQSGISPAERARLEIDAASLRGDAAALEHGASDLTKAEPGDLDAWKVLAQSAFGRHDYRQAQNAYQKVLAIQPDDTNSLNQYAYSAAYNRDLAAATSELHRYQSLRPNDANALDSLGDVHLILGRLKEAEDFYLQVVKKDSNFLGGVDWWKAAMARLMTGDVPGADRLMERFVAARSAAHDPMAATINPSWQWLSGRRKSAAAAMNRLAGESNGQVSSQVTLRALSQLAIWSLLEGNRAEAERTAARALAASGRAPNLDVVIAQFLSQPAATPAEWQARADRLVPNPAERNLRDSIVAYALLVSHEYGAAADVLRRLYDGEAAASSEAIPVLLAWCYLETGRVAEAAPLLEFNPVPSTTGPNVFTAFYFPRLYELRAQVAEKQGKADAASANRKLFDLLSANR
jgi:tetratricopeptide (TPR) repeat protein